MNIRMFFAAAMIAMAAPDLQFALAADVFFDDFEAGTLGTQPTTPVTGQPWFHNGPAVATANTVQANPLPEGINTSAQVMRSFRGPGVGGGYAWIDLTGEQQAELESEQLLTVEFKYLQVSPTNGGELAMYDNANHDFTNNALDLNWFANGTAYWYDGTVPQFKPVGAGANATGSDAWDQCKVVVDFSANHWSIQVNNGEIFVQPFTNGDDMSKVQTLFFAPASQNVQAYWDDIQVTIGSGEGIPGDFNGDGNVDGADFVAWQTHFPTESGAALADGDANADGTVDGADFVVWQTHFPFPSAPAPGAVPEPSAVALLVSALAAIYARCKLIGVC
ncbi:MAG: dockerin type I repeat-containing protein [Pirellulales bacterium]|nr:dockerin type I repeat-containing protein [Pirellulales bacterium]